jgi:mRNA-degrading endonuclease RelE of RelBE toxin-antitoxin system
MTSVRFHQLAADELKEIYQWYDEQNKDISSSLSEAIGDAKNRISQDPLSHEIEIKHFRWVKVRRFPYRLIYEILDDERTLILAVAHTSRDPGYWKTRT